MKRRELVSLRWICAWLSMPFCLFACAAILPFMPAYAPPLSVLCLLMPTALRASGYFLHWRGRSLTLDTFSARILQLSSVYSTPWGRNGGGVGGKERGLVGGEGRN